MSKKLFNREEVEILKKNEYVKNVTEKAITYTNEFKKKFILEYDKGGIPRKIFESCGFSIDIIGIKRVETSSKRWREKYRENGIMGLDDTRKGNSGRPREKDLSLEEKYERLKAQNAFLKVENEFLKKLETLERKVIKRN